MKRRDAESAEEIREQKLCVHCASAFPILALDTFSGYAQNACGHSQIAVYVIPKNQID